MNITSLRYFVVLAQYGNFSKTAEKVFITQPALSRHIKRLEQEFGAPLFIRNSNSCQLTNAGKEYLNEAKQILFHVDNILALQNEYQRGERGALTIGHSGVEDSHLFLFIKRILQYHPNIDITLRKETNFHLTQLLVRGDLDFVFGLNYDFVNLDSAIEYRRVQQSRTKLLVPKDHPFARQDRVSITQLADMSFVLWERDNCPSMFDEFFQICQAHGFTPTVASYEYDSNNIFSYVSAGRGVGITAAAFQDTVNPKLFSLVDIELADGSCFPERELVIAWNRKSTNSSVNLVAKSVMHTYEEAET